MEEAALPQHKVDCQVDVYRPATMAENVSIKVTFYKLKN
jgi:hypothetical protein